MSYTVLARRYRSKDFDDLVGQEPIAQTLKNAIQANRVAHAYLFCGTRGVGKTSVARILAKALNCEKGPTPKPCNVCDRCKAISAGEDIDVIEIDGASNRGIEEIRALRSNAIYRPARSPYKIYIIDEVHMLTREAFNALLKTLEEPPSHVKFIFATTETHKVPQTIASRCQQFIFRLIPTTEIADRLSRILELEKIAADPAVVLRLARAGRGSMRDALSLMDQLLAMGGGELTEQQVDYLLGEPALDQIVALGDALAGNDAGSALSRVDQLLAGGFAPEQFVVALIEHCRRLMLLGVMGKDCPFLDVGSGERARLIQQAGLFNPLTLVYMIEVLEQLRQSVRASTIAARALIDATLVRLAMLDQFADTAELLERVERGGSGLAEVREPDAKKKFSAEPARSAPPESSQLAPQQASSQQAANEGAARNVPDIGPPVVGLETPLEQIACDELWKRLLARMDQPSLRIMSGPLALVSLVGAEGERLRLAAQPGIRKLLSDPRRQEQLQAVLGQLLDRPILIEWVQQDPAGGGMGALPTGGGREARAADGQGADEASSGAPPARLSQQEVEQVMADPTLRRIMDVFEASVIGIVKRQAEPVDGKR